jgi:hypothetical protein
MSFLTNFMIYYEIPKKLNHKFIVTDIYYMMKILDFIRTIFYKINF